jgi:hypothetical protein
MLAVCLVASTLVAAGGQTLQYRLEPGQVWNATTTTRTESSVGGHESSDGQKNLIEYRIKAGS